MKKSLAWIDKYRSASPMERIGTLFAECQENKKQMMVLFRGRVCFLIHDCQKGEFGSIPLFDDNDPLSKIVFLLQPEDKCNVIKKGFLRIKK